MGTLRSVSVALAGVLLLSTFSVTAQITVTAVRGLVRDPSGAVVPGVDLKLKDEATGIERSGITGADGSFIFANLVEGTYRLTASLTGFQTAVYESVVVNAGRTTDLTVEIKVGNTSEIVEVTASAVQLETTSNTSTSTIKHTNIHTLPNRERSTLDLALLVPGAASANNNRNSTFNGLPNASLNITLDGMNNNSQRFKSGGTSFFAFAPMRIDAVEEITVSTSGMGAEAAGQGAMTIQVVTRRGTDKYHFRVLEQWHNEWLNATPYATKLAMPFDSNAVKPRTRQNFIVGSAGGPLVPWVHYLKDKLFFFAYFEAEPAPATVNRSVSVLQREALAGDFAFIDRNGARRTLNVLDVARRNGYPSTVDPTAKAMLEEIRDSESAPGVTLQDDPTLPFQRTLRWNKVLTTTQYYPTARVDYQITPRLAWHGSWNFRNSFFAGTTGAPYPGEAAARYDWSNSSKANVYTASNTLDWTASQSLFNQFVYGIQRSGEFFNPGFDIRQWQRYGDRRLTLPIVTAYIPTTTSDVRNNPVVEVKDNLTWIKGRHTFKAGGSLLHTTFWSRFYGNFAGVPNYTFGIRTDDPINNVLDTAINDAGVVLTNNTDRNNFKNLYALLTGRINAIAGTTNVNPATSKFEKFFSQPTNFGFTTVGLFFQDSFRFKPDLTLNYGLRWQLDGAIHGTIPIYSTVAPEGVFGPSKANFQPGTLGGTLNPEFIQNSSPYERDFLNPAPNLGFAWNPRVEGGILGKLLGGRKTVVRGSLGVTFYNEGINTVSNYLPGGPGATQSLAATANVNFTPGQLFLSSPDPSLSVNPSSFTFPIPLSQFVLNGGRSINAFNPHLRSPYVTNWTFGIQRELTRGLLLEVRYVGNKSTHMWHQQNLNEINVVENGFAAEFVNAQKNLAVNRGAGVTSFANRGLAGQVPLPIFETAFGANGTQPALAATAGFGSTTYIQNLDFGQAGTLADTLGSTTSPTLYCRLVGANFAPCSGLGYTTLTKYPMNFFKANPFANNVNYLDSNADNNYNSLQVVLSKQMARGLMFNVAYTWGHAIGTQGNLTGQGAEDTWITLRDARLSYGDVPFDRRHIFSTFWQYDLPMGPGRWLRPSSRILSRIVSNWTIAGIDRIASGDPQFLTGGRATFNNLGADGGVVFGSGMTAQQLIDRLDTTVGGYDHSCRCFRTNVATIQQANGAVDPKYYSPGDTPGVIGNPIPYRGKATFQLDLSISKEIPIGERVRMGLKANISNFLNHPFRTAYGNTTVTGTTFGQVGSSSFTGTRNINLRMYVDF